MFNRVKAVESYISNINRLNIFSKRNTSYLRYPPTEGTISNCLEGTVVDRPKNSSKGNPLNIFKLRAAPVVRH